MLNTICYYRLSIDTNSDIFIFFNSNFSVCPEGPIVISQHELVMVMAWCQVGNKPLPALIITPDSKVHGANMGPIWGQQDPGGHHVGPMNFAIWDPILWGILNAWLGLNGFIFSKIITIDIPYLAYDGKVRDVYCDSKFLLISSICQYFLYQWLNTLRPRQILQMTFSSAFPWIKMCDFHLRFHWNFFLRF